MTTLYEVMYEATTTGPRWTNKQIAQFHYFNQYGLYAAKRVSDDMITDAVSSGVCKSGAIIAHGSMNDSHTEQLCKLAQMKRVDSISLQVTLQSIQRDIDEAQKFLCDVYFKG